MKNFILLITLIATLAQSLCATNKLNQDSNTFSSDLTQTERHLLIQQALQEGLITQDTAEQLDPTAKKTGADKSNPNKMYYIAGGVIASILVIASGYYLYTDFIQHEEARVTKLAEEKALQLAHQTEQQLLPKQGQVALNAATTALQNSVVNQPLQQENQIVFDPKGKNHNLVNTAGNIALGMAEQQAGFSADDQRVAQDLANIAIDVATGNHIGAIMQATDLVTHPQAIQHVAQELHTPLSNAAHNISSSAHQTAHDISNSAHQTAEAMSHLFHKKPNAHNRGNLGYELEDGEIYED